MTRIELLANKCYYIWEMNELEKEPTKQAEKLYRIINIKLKIIEKKLE